MQNNHSTEEHSKQIKDRGRLAGAVGLVLLISAPLTWLITGTLGWITAVKLVLALVLLVYDVWSNPTAMAKMLGGRSTSLLAMSTASIVLVLAMVIGVNIVAVKNPKEWDITAEHIHTLSPQTVEILERLKEDVNVLAFYAPRGNEEALVADEILKRYSNHSKKFTYTLIDPHDRPDLMQQYQITEGGPQIVLTTASGREARAKGPWEEDLTQALIKVAEQSAKTVYVLLGHDEPALDNDHDKTGYKIFVNAIQADGYDIGTVSLLDGHKVPTKETVRVNAQEKQPVLKIPDDVGLLIVPTGKRDLLSAEVDALDAFLNRGGRLFLFLEPHRNQTLKPLLERWGMQAMDDTVIDTNPVTRLLGLGAMSPLATPADPRHVTTEDLGAGVIFSGVRSFMALQAAGISVEPLLLSGSSAWGETELKNGIAEFGKQDREGPIPVAMVGTRQGAEGTPSSRWVVFGDSDWVNNQFFGMQGNRDMALNIINWLLEDENKISIRPKYREASQVYLSEGQLRQITFFAMDFLPVLIVAMGLALVMSRRQR